MAKTPEYKDKKQPKTLSLSQETIADLEKIGNASGFVDFFFRHLPTATRDQVLSDYFLYMHVYRNIQTGIRANVSLENPKKQVNFDKYNPKVDHKLFLSKLQERLTFEQFKNILEDDSCK